MAQSTNSAKFIAGYSVTYTQDSTTKKWASDKGNLWSSANASTDQFAKEAHLKIGNRAKNHAEIPSPYKTKSFAEFLDNYLKGNLNFKKMSEGIITNSGLQLSKSRSYKRLMLTFLSYSCDVYNKASGTFTPTERLLVVLLKDKTVLRIQKNNPDSVEIIDFDDILHAGMVDTNDFKNSSATNANFDISFINGSSDYFINFLDAKGLIHNKESVSEILDALNDFFKANQTLPSEKNKIKSNLSVMMQKHKKDNVETTIEDVSNKVYDSMSTNTAKKFNRDSFQKYVLQGTYKVNESFYSTSTLLEKLDFVPVSSPVGELKIRPSFFGKHNKGKLNSAEFDKKSKSLTIKTKISDDETVQAILRAIEK